MPGLIRSIEPGSVAAQAGLKPGDLLVSINGHALRDVIDAQFYGAEETLTLAAEREGTTVALEATREFGQSLGIEFEHPTFDIDIRRCNNLCPFCFVLQNAPRMRRTLYIKDDDYRYSFLFGHFVTLTNLGEEDWARLAEQRLSPLYVSVHATDPEVRRKCLRNPTSGDILAQLRWLAGHGIETHTQLVITPGLNDGKVMEQSVRDLAALYPRVQSVSVVPVGLTKHHKYGHHPHTREEAAAVVEAVEAWQAMYQEKLGARFAYLTDEWYLVSGRPLPKKRDYDGLALQENGLGMVRGFLDEWQRLKRGEAKGPLQPTKFQHATLATATLFAPTLAKTAREFTRRTGVPLDVVPIRNERLGETITVSGLLMGQDVIDQLMSGLGQTTVVHPPSSVVILPRIMFDHPDGVSLDDLSPMAVAKAIGRPVALADWMGDVLDALNGRNKLFFDPAASDLDIPIAREGGWAVEKYL
jgi:putative radical SAM enzyme (TIGR03279 family)